MRLNGVILKGIGGFYYVKTDNGTVECKARGIFRKNGQTPLAGDCVVIETEDMEEGVVDEILERKNSFVRPAVANIDNLVIVVSTTKPKPNLLLIDKICSIAEYKGITPILVITKTDLNSHDEIYSHYNKTPYKIILTDNTEKEDISELLSLLEGKISAFCGNSGVGKSTLLNNIVGFDMTKIGEISDKLGRGRHTTREVELFPLKCGGYIADSPGFGSVDTARYELIKKEELELTFPEFANYLDNCKFTGCSHRSEKGCAVLAAVGCGEIGIGRFENYKILYDEAAKIKEWERR